MNNILVSVYMLAYNHEKYIRQAIENVVNQKANFKFELIIHDDASTDKTAQIIKEYAQKYPEIIKPIYQTENQFSRKISIFNEYIFPCARGKYMAICEGDDYWTDENKLAIQVGYMESHPECTLIGCAGEYIKANGKGTGRFFHLDGGDRDITTKEAIEKWLFPTASLLYRRELRNQPIPFMKDAPCGDYPLIIWASLQGTVHYIDRSLCVYRIMSNSSLSRLYAKDIKKHSESLKGFLSMYEQIDAYTEFRYSESIDIPKKEKQHLLEIDKILIDNIGPIKCIKRAKACQYSPSKLLLRKYCPAVANFIIRLIMLRHL